MLIQSINSVTQQPTQKNVQKKKSSPAFNATLRDIGGLTDFFTTLGKERIGILDKLTAIAEKISKIKVQDSIKGKIIDPIVDILEGGNWGFKIKVIIPEEEKMANFSKSSEISLSIKNDEGKNANDLVSEIQKLSNAMENDINNTFIREKIAKIQGFQDTVNKKLS